MSNELISRVFPTNDELHEAADALYDIKLGENIASARKARGLTQSKFAEIMGVKQSDISRIETGHVPPSHKKLKKIARKLSVKLTPPQLQVSKDTDLAINAHYSFTVSSSSVVLQKISDGNFDSFSTKPGDDVESTTHEQNLVLLSE